MRPGLPLAVGASLILGSACAAPAYDACPLVYAPAGVIFRLDELGDRAATAEIRACMDDHCVTRTDASPSAERVPLVAGAEDATGPRTVTARLVLTDPAAGTIIFDASTRVTLRRVDAPRCADPDRTAYQATVRATATGTLVPN